jgi:glyoxylase-like metal-dependent hydrolase (beta-lactamase superfamily II)
MRSQGLRLAPPLAFFSLLLVAWRLSPAQEVELIPEHVAGPVHMITGQGGNLGVSAGPDGVLLIDDQFAPLAPKIQASLAALAEAAGLDSGAPRFLINTHHHGDHTGGNAIFGEAATILAHANVRARLLAPGRGEPMVAAGLPVVTYADGLSLHFNGEEIRLVHLPRGHTDGDTAVFFTGSKVVHVGDLFFNGRFPFIDIDGGGSIAGYLEGIQLVLDLTDANTRYIPGHGPLASRADLEALHAMLIDAQGLVRGALAEGKSADDMKAAKLLEKYAAWGWGFVDAGRMIDTLVRGLAE